MNLDRRSVLRGIGLTGAVVATGTGLGAALEDDEARVRVVHASPDAPNVDVYVDGDRALADVSFNTVSSFLTVPAGERSVTITAAGDPDTVAFEGPVTVEGGNSYTVAAIGELGEGTFRPKVLRERYVEDSSNRCAFRVVHASPDAPAVDVNVGRFTLYHGVEFGDVGQFYALPAIELTFDVAPASGGDPVTSAELDLQRGKTYTVFATGYLTPEDEPGDSELGLLPGISAPDESDEEETQTGKVRVAHASPDAPDVDVYVDGDRALADVSFTTISDYLEVPAGERNVTITAAGDPDTVAFEGPVTVEADTAYTVAAIGELSEDTFRPKVLVDDADTGPGSSAVRVLHAAPDAPAVDVTVDDAETTVVDGLEFGASSGYASVKPGNYEFEVRPDSPGDDNPFDAEFHARIGREPVTAIATGYFTAFDEPADEQFTLALATDESAD